MPINLIGKVSLCAGKVSRQINNLGFYFIGANCWDDGVGEMVKLTQLGEEALGADIWLQAEEACDGSPEVRLGFE